MEGQDLSASQANKIIYLLIYLFIVLLVIVMRDAAM